MRRDALAMFSSVLDDSDRLLEYPSHGSDDSMSDNDSSESEWKSELEIKVLHVSYKNGGQTFQNIFVVKRCTTVL